MATMRVEAYLAGGAGSVSYFPLVWLSSSGGAGWADLTSDLVADDGLYLEYGVDGNKPSDSVASSGQVQFSLRNDAHGAVPQGYYSPNHANCRTGWGFGVPVRVTFTNLGIDYVKFHGKVQLIDPVPGTLGLRRVRVTAYDAMRDLVRASVRELDIAVDQTEDALLTAVIDAVPANAQPLTRSFDPGLDSVPYAFDNVKDGQPAAALLHDIVTSSLGLLVMKGDGTLKYFNRRTRATAPSAFSFTDATMSTLSVPSDAQDASNRVRTTIHPKTLSATATEVLYAQPDGATVVVNAGEIIDVWTDYTDPNDRKTHVGGYQVVTILVGGTHYAANSAKDGSGTDLTASITATLTPFASTAKWTLTNTGTIAAYITTLQVIGKCVRDPGPQAFEQSSVQTYGDHLLDLDMPYQANAATGDSVARFLLAQQETLTNQTQELGFVANKSSALMVQALSREPGDRVTVTETMTGVAADAIIHKVALTVERGLVITCLWGLAPAAPYRMWTLGESALSETTVLGF